MNFQTDVLDRSHEIPVLVDFWAEWCGPCRVLGPVLDTVADTFKGQLELVKLNTEEYPDIAQQYRVMSIPNVKLFHRGQVINEFAGALPKHAVEKWLEENLPSGDAIALQDILDQRAPWPSAALTHQLEEMLPSVTDQRQLKMLLAKEIVLSDPQRAVDLTGEIASIEGAFEMREDIHTLAELMSLQNGDGPINDALLAIQELLRKHELEAAVKAVVDVTMQDKSYANDLPRRAGIALFHMLGTSHPVTRQYRKLFDMAIY